MLHDKESAADAVQDTLTKLWRMRWRLGMMKNAPGYAMRALQHECLDKLRHSHVEQNAVAKMGLAEDTDNTIYDRLTEAIAALPERQRKLIDLKYQEQKSSAEIAEIMGLSISNVDTIMSRAYATLRKIMEKQSEEVRK